MKCKLLRCMIDINADLPKGISEENWKIFCAFTKKQGISNLLYNKLKLNKPDNFPDEEFLQLKKTYEGSFVHHARIDFEVEKISIKLKNAGISFCFLKGYPLSKKFYRHSTERDFEDIDMYIPQKYHSLLDNIFKDEHYSKMPEQSSIEKKPSFIKLMGHHAYMFEIHDNLYTSYFEKQESSLLTIFNNDGIPNDTELFISVLLHHKYFESRLRDYIDLEFIYKKKGVNFAKIITYAKNEKLFKHFLTVIMLSEKFLCSSWGNEVKDKSLCSVFNKLTFSFILKSKEISITFFPFQRNFFTKVCDMLLTTLVYDDFSKGLECFINKYFKYVKMEKYFKIFRQMIKKN